MHKSQKKSEPSIFLKGSIDIVAGEKALKRDDSNRDRYTIDSATKGRIEELDPPELNELLSSLNPNTLLTRKETIRFLNVLDKRVDDLVISGKLSRDKNGCFLAGEVYNYKFEKSSREKEGLQAIAEYFSN